MEQIKLEIQKLYKALDKLETRCDKIKNLKTDIILQGNLDPNKINRGGKELEDAVNKLLLSTKDRKHIYCSGHGLLPNTPTKNVERVIEIIKN